MSWRPLPDHSPAPPRPLSGSLDGLARSMGAPGAAALAAVFGNWGEVVGPADESRCRPLWLGGGVLVVGVDHPAAATGLRYRCEEILARAAEVAGAPVADRLEVRVRQRR